MTMSRSVWQLSDSCGATDVVAGEGLGVDRDGAHVGHAILRLLTRQGASDDRENLATSHTNEHEHEHTHVRGRKGRRPGQR